MNNIIITIINIVHLFIVACVLILPFTNSPYLLTIHMIFIPFMIFHWLTNNNTCVLTMTEKFLRGVKNKEEENKCFTSRLINPIFDFTKDYKNFSKLIYIITIGLWLLSTSKIGIMIGSGKVRNMKDLLKI